MIRFRWTLGVVVLATCVTACGTGGREKRSVAYWVSASSGSDSNPGNYTEPFRTITHALSVVSVGQIVTVAPGIYDVKNGESFPLVVPINVTLRGDVANAGMPAAGQPTLIQGAGPSGLSSPGTTTLRALAGARIAGFSIVNPEVTDVPGSTTGVATGILIRAPFVEVDSCTISDCSEGIRFRGYPSNAAEPVGCVVKRCHLTGDIVGMDAEVYKETGVRVEGNQFEECHTGARADGTGVDFGGGPQGSPGENVFRCNDVHIFAGGAQIGDFRVDPYMLWAGNNHWDPAPPPIVPLVYAGISPETGEIAYLEGATVLVFPAFAADPCPH